MVWPGCLVLTLCYNVSVNPGQYWRHFVRAENTKLTFYFFFSSQQQQQQQQADILKSDEIPRCLLQILHTTCRPSFLPCQGSFTGLEKEEAEKKSDNVISFKAVLYYLPERGICITYSRRQGSRAGHVRFTVGYCC